MPTEFVEERDGGFWITGTRVSLDFIVYAFLRARRPRALRNPSHLFDW